MTEPKTVTVKIKCDDDKTIKQKFLIYEDMTASTDDAIVKQCVADAKEGIKAGIEHVTVTISFEVI